MRGGIHTKKPSEGEVGIFPGSGSRWKDGKAIKQQSFSTNLPGSVAWFLDFRNLFKSSWRPAGCGWYRAELAFGLV